MYYPHVTLDFTFSLKEAERRTKEALRRSKEGLKLQL